LKSGVLAQHFDDAGRGGAALKLFEDERLILMRCAVDAGLTGGHTLARQYNSLDILKEIVGGPGACGRGDHDAAATAIHGNHGPRCEGGVLDDDQTG